MSIHARSWQYVTCDECKKEGPEGYTSVEIRAKAYNIGWRFPPRSLRGGGKSSNRTHDICPDCVGTSDLVSTIGAHPWED